MNPGAYIVHKKEKIVQSSAKDAEDNLRVYLLISMDEQVSKRSHVLKTP